MNLPVGVQGALNGLIPLALDSSGPSAPFTHDRALAALSMVAAVAGAYAALELSARAQAREGRVGLAWMAAAGLMLGAGVWAMHFIALVGLQTPLLRGISAGPTVASCIIALVCASTGFLIGGRGRNLWRLAIAGLWFGVGSVLMHYVGMRGLVIDADLTYRPLFVAGTGLGAFACSTVGLWLCASPHPAWARFGLAFPIGAAVASLHFFDIAGTVLAPRPSFAPPVPADVGAAIFTALAIGLAALAAWLLAWWDARREPAPALRPQRAAGMTKQAAGAEPNEGVVVVPDSSERASSR